MAAADPRADNGALASRRAATGGTSTEVDVHAPSVRWRAPKPARATRGRAAVVLRWRAHDARGTGVAASSVQIRRRLSGGGWAPWTTIVLDSRGRTATVIAAKATHRVQFRVRVTDRAGNVSGYRKLPYRF